METPILQTKDLKLYYGNFQALKGISMTIQEKTITAFIGPSGCGKSTFLKVLNRMNDPEYTISDDLNTESESRLFAVQ